MAAKTADAGAEMWIELVSGRITSLRATVGVLRPEVDVWGGGHGEDIVG